MSTAEARAAATFAALGDATRLSLMVRLGDGQAMSIAALTRDSGMTRQGVAKHLRVLEGAGLVAAQRHGRETRFALVPTRVEAARDYLDWVARQWDAALGRLRTFVDG